MDYVTILLRAFLIGVTGACGIGPVFVLLCNTAVRNGFFPAVSIALGASTADSLYFYAALSGLLSWSQQLTSFSWIFDLTMLMTFTFLAFNVLYSKKEKISIESVEVHRYYEGFLKGFFLTILNPFVAVYFLGVSAKLLSLAESRELAITGVDAILAVAAGSSAMLVLIAGLVHFVGLRLNSRVLDILNKCTGYAFILISLYFAYSLLNIFLH